MSRDASTFYDDEFEPQDRDSEVQSIGEILQELLAPYQARLPNVSITVVETPAATAV